MPTVLSTTPHDGSADVSWENPTATVEFDTPMDPASFTTATVTWHDVPAGYNVPAAPSYDAASMSMTLRATQPLNLHSQYVITLDGVLAADGSPLPAFSFSFTTVASMGPVLINVGATSDYTASDGRVWKADVYFKGGTVRQVTAAVSGTPDPKLYQNERYGLWTYAVPVPVGLYDVKFHFAETLYLQKGKRVFSIECYDTPASPDIANLDIFAAAGGANKALIRTLSGLRIADKTLSLRALAVTDNPTLSALEMIRAGD